MNKLYQIEVILLRKLVNGILGQESYSSQFQTTYDISLSSYKDMFTINIVQFSKICLSLLWVQNLYPSHLFVISGLSEIDF